MIRYSEIFFSFQGEAEMTGQPSAWIRLFGCNLECSGFGQTNPTDPSTYELPYKEFDLSTIKKVEDLPVWTKGCDSSYSWSSKFRHLAHQNTADEIAILLEDQLKHPSNPEGKFVHPITKQPFMLSITGGEPMLQQKAIVEIIEALSKRGNCPEIINIETNATQEIRDIFGGFPSPNPNTFKIHFSMSPKLYTVSGEKDVIDEEIIFDYALRSDSSVLKFVCNGTQECWEELDSHLIRIRERFDGNFRKIPPVWIMPVGATLEEQQEKWIADLNTEAMKRGYNVANRMQCFIYGNSIGK